MKTGRFPIAEFKETRRLNPYWSSWVCFCEIIRERDNLSKRTVRRSFDELVDKKDYLKSERGELLKHLYNLSTDSN